MLDWVNESAFRQAVEVAQRHCDEFGFPPPLDDPKLEAWDILTLWDDSTDETAIDELVGLVEPHDPVTRAVVAATLYLKGGKKATDDDAARRALTDFARSEDVDLLISSEALRWELHLAVTARCVDRGLALTRRLESIENFAVTPELRLVTATELFFAVHPLWGTVNVDGPGLLDPLVGHLAQDPNGVLARRLRCYQLATAIADEQRNPWKDMRALSGSTREALIEIDISVTRVLQANAAVAPDERAAQIWSRFCLAGATSDRRSLSRIGEDYLNLPRFCIGDTEVADGLEAATVTLAAAGDWPKAATAATAWAERHSGDPRAHWYQAKALYKQDESDPRLRQALENYAHALPERDDEWEATLLWHWGTELERLRATEYERVAAEAPERSFGEHLQGWLWPRFDSLSRDAKKRWWTAVHSLASPQNAANIPDMRWKVAAHNFGEAIANELKARIFSPFAATKPSLVDLDDRRLGIWKKVLNGKGTLGQLIGCLRESQTPSGATAKRLNEWLEERHPRLPNFIRANKQKLQAIADLRGEGAHDSAELDERPLDDERLDATALRNFYKYATDLLDRVEANETPGA